VVIGMQLREILVRNTFSPLIDRETKKWLRASCSCGRALPLMNSIVGREIDLIKLPKGNVVHGAFFNCILKDSEWIAKYGITNFQVGQKKMDHFVLKLESRRKPSQRALESFESLMKRHLGEVAFDIDFIDQIPVSGSVKR